MMTWRRSDTLPLAREGCTSCDGLGIRSSWGSRERVCECTLRRIFRICYARFRSCTENNGGFGRVTLESIPSSNRRNMWSMKREEYCADFCTVARNTLTEEEHRIFRLHFLLGADWKACVEKLGGDKGLFFHAVYRIEQKLGLAFRETAPYPLFPLDEYFGGTRRIEPRLRKSALRFPIAKASGA